jgi:hypothetical protein
MNYTFYKIRHKKTQRWSKGGIYVNGAGDNSYWTDKENGGKTWDTLGKLRAHITAHLRLHSGGRATDMSDWQVVECKCVTVDIKNINDVITPDKIIQLLKQ